MAAPIVIADFQFCDGKGAETWVLTKATEPELASTQRRIDRRLVVVRLLGKKTNAWIRGVTEVKEMIASKIERK
ncbi:hypothetical protein Y032_0327g2591 [Ancylostoma ceylanicum]|uniref:Uncharacterized protein n=1 Tax=Ancylostoma ceylanicum TaxID=53326 RepID=A0A016S0T3_9BILA|nr:hypothetical protein Y032_0327g2591 [Ancylostoma ceylanicum]